MVTVYDYPEDAVAAAHAVLLEVLTVLGTYRDAIVLVGGWVPPLSFPGAGHVGSLDIDLALDERRISPSQYATILECLRKAGYREGPEPNQFERDVALKSGQSNTVRVDLLAAEYGGTGKRRRHQRIQGLIVRKARGVELAFQHSKTRTVSGGLPDGGTNSVAVRVAEIVPFLVMKGMALFDRMKQKDAYDIHFRLRHCTAFAPAASEPIIAVASQAGPQRALARRLSALNDEHQCFLPLNVIVVSVSSTENSRAIDCAPTL